MIWFVLKDELHYKLKLNKFYKFNEGSSPIGFQEICMTDIYHQKMLLISKIIFTAKINNLDKGNKTIEKYFFKKITQQQYLIRENKFLITFKSDYFQ